MTQVRIGVIGVGWWGTVGHLEPLSANPQVEIAAIWSRTEGKAQARAEQYGVPRHYTDYRKMIDEAELDGVVIASTPNMHFEQARYALERGLHVLMEKPFVLCAEHAMELRRLATQGNRLLSVCHPVLFMPAMIRARELVRSGALGQLVMVSAVHAQRVYDLYKGDVETVFDQRPGMPRPNDLSYADPSIVGGGEGHTQASHILGTILWLTGLEPTYVYCAMNPLDTQVDVIDAMVIRFSNGCLAAVGANGLLPAGVAARGVQLHGAHGILEVGGLTGDLTLFSDGQTGPQALAVPTVEGLDTRAAVGANFVRAMLGEEPLHVETGVALDEACILDAAYRSAASGREEAIDRQRLAQSAAFGE